MSKTMISTEADEAFHLTSTGRSFSMIITGPLNKTSFLIKNLLHYLYWGIRRPNLAWLRFFSWIIRPQKMIFLFGEPFHTNLGDNAQTYCIKKWLKENYPSYGIRCFNLPSICDSDYKNLKKHMRKNDRIFIHSGYHITDLYNEISVYKKIIQLFPEKKITIFPQTIYYKDENKLRETADLFNRHGNITLMCRDEESFSVAQSFFSNCRLLLMPDIVTTLIGTFSYNNHRQGILFCIRKDKEAFYSNKQIEELRVALSTYKTDITDTTLNMPAEEMAKNRKKILMQELEKYSHYQLIITDRYHGTIFSLISGTPVIVLKTRDHKLHSGVKWFPSEFANYVFYASDLDSAQKKAEEILTQNFQYSPQMPSYFKDKYYTNLKQVIDL